MQESLVATSLDAGNDCGGQAASEATAPKFRVGADATDFGVTGKSHALARHSHQASADPNPDEGSHGMRPRQDTGPAPLAWPTPTSRVHPLA